MEQITLGDLARAFAFLVGLGGSITTIILGVQRVVKKLLEPLIIDQCKDFIVQELSLADRGSKLTEIEKLRLAERYKKYTDLNQNSYIKEWYQRLKDEGKL